MHYQQQSLLTSFWLLYLSAATLTIYMSLREKVYQIGIWAPNLLLTAALKLLSNFLMSYLSYLSNFLMELPKFTQPKYNEAQKPSFDLSYLTLDSLDVFFAIWHSRNRKTGLGMIACLCVITCANQETRCLGGQRKARHKLKLRGLILPVQILNSSSRIQLS